MTTPTKDTLLALLKRKELNDLVGELEKGKTTFEEMLARTEAQWGKIAGTANGIAIYNHLHTSIRSLISHALPPLGPRELSCSVSKTRMESAYSIQIAAKVGSFGILDEFTRDKLNPSASSLLWTEAESGRLKPWSGENSIQRLVQHALMDCLKLTQFEAKAYQNDVFNFSNNGKTSGSC